MPTLKVDTNECPPPLSGRDKFYPPCHLDPLLTVPPVEKPVALSDKPADGLVSVGGEASESLALVNVTTGVREPIRGPRLDYVCRSGPL